MLRSLFVDKRELFAMKLSFEEFNLVFFTAHHSAWLSLACFEFLKKLEVHCVLYGHRNYVFKREFLCSERFHGRFLHFDNGVKEKTQNVHLKLIFCHLLSRFNLRFNLRERTQEPFSVILDLFFRINLWVFDKNFQEIKLFICHCSFITLAQNTIVRLQIIRFLETLQTKYFPLLN